VSPSELQLSFKRILKLWLPLASTWLMMAFEGPFLSAVIARLPDETFNLAAYGVAFSFALIVEAPIIMMLSAATALVKDAPSYRKLRNFTFFLNGVLTLVLIFLLIPPVFHRVMMDWIQLPAEVAQRARWALWILLPWPGAIGYRRFFQGILIRFNQTGKVALGTLLRLITVILVAGTFAYWEALPGVVVGASALSAGVVVEALTGRWMARPVLRSLFRSSDAAGSPNHSGLTYRNIAAFYYPLALTALLALAVHPIATFFMGRSRLPVQSLAVLPVMNALIFVFRSVGLSFQEVVIALLEENRRYYPTIRKFGYLLGGVLLAGLGILAFTPLLDVWYQTISGLNATLSQLARVPTRIMVWMPVLTLWISFQRAVLVVIRKTQPITLASVLEVASIAFILWITIYHLDFVGVVAASLAFVLGRLLANGWLAFPVWRGRRWFVNG